MLVAPAPFCRLGLQFCEAAAAILVSMVVVARGGGGGGGERRTDISLKSHENLPLKVAVKEIARAAIQDTGGQL